MRDVFDRYIGATPAPQFDLDAVARRGRRIRRLRTAYAGGGVALAISAGAVTLALLPLRPGNPHPTATATSAAPSVSASPVAEPDRLLAVLRNAIAREAPNLTGAETLQRYVMLCEGSDAYGPNPVPYTPQVAPSTCPGTQGQAVDVSRSYIWYGRITGPGGVYELRVFIHRGQYVDPASPPVDETDALERRLAEEQGNAPQRGPNGESILAGPFHLSMTKPDGTDIMIRVLYKGKDGHYSNRSPFTARQLTAIGMDPGLHM
jgi:hypothetical protein